MERLPLTEEETKRLVKKAPFTFLFALLMLAIAAATGIGIFIPKPEGKITILVADLVLITCLLLYVRWKRKKEGSKNSGTFKLVYKTRVTGVKKEQRSYGTGVKKRYYDLYHVSLDMGDTLALGQEKYNTIKDAEMIQLEMRDPDRQIIRYFPLDSKSIWEDKGRAFLDIAKDYNATYESPGYELPDGSGSGKEPHTFQVDFRNGMLLISLPSEWHPYENRPSGYPLYARQGEWLPALFRQLRVSACPGDVPNTCLVTDLKEAHRVWGYLLSLQEKYYTKPEEKAPAYNVRESYPQKQASAQEKETPRQQKYYGGFEFVCEPGFSKRFFREAIGKLLIHVNERDIAFRFFGPQEEDDRIFGKIKTFYRLRHPTLNLIFENDPRSNEYRIGFSDQGTKETILQELFLFSDQGFEFNFSTGSYKLPQGGKIPGGLSDSNYFKAAVSKKTGTLFSPMYREKYQEGPSQGLTHPIQETWFPLVLRQLAISFKKTEDSEYQYYQVQEPASMIRFLDFAESLQKENRS